jgi:hypothetical protein
MKNKQHILFIGLMLVGSFILHAESVNVPASAFQQGDDGSVSYEISENGYVFSPNGPVTLFARVALPDEVWIKNIRVFYYDNDPSNDISVYLDRFDLDYHPSKYTLFSITSDSASSVVRNMVDSSVSPPLKGYRGVNNDSSQIYLRVELASGDNHRIYGVTIQYEQW